MRIIAGQPFPDPGDSPIWDGVQWLYAPPIPGPRGKGGGCGTQGPPGPPGPPAPSSLCERVCVPPSSTTNALVVAEVLAGNKILQFGVGQYGLEAPLFTGLTPEELSGVDIQGQGQGTVLEPTYISPAGDASLPTNTVVLVQGAPDPGSYSSVLTRHAIIGDRTMALAADVTAQVGGFLVASGHNDPATAMGGLAAGDNITATEVIKVESVSGGGLIAHIAGVLLQEHTITNGGTGQPQSVQAVRPVQGFRLANMSIIGTGHQIAVGVLLDYVVEPILEDLWFEGFSLADYFARLGTRTIEFRNIVHQGGSNSWCFLQSVGGGRVTDFYSIGLGDRFHPLGTLQGAVNLAWNTTQVEIGDFVLRRACRGIQIGAVMQINIHDGLVDDMFIAELLTRPAIAESSFCGIGFDGGRGPLADTAFSMGVILEQVRFTNCRSNGPIDVNSPYTVFFHDILDLWADIVIDNEGESPYSVIDGQNYVMQGINLLDSSGNFKALVRGVEFGCTLRSTSGTMRAEELRILGNPGAGVVATIGLYQFKLPAFNGFTIGRLWSEPACSYAGASVNDIVYIENYYLAAAGYEFGKTQTFVNGTGGLLQFGDLFQVDPAGVATIFQPATTIAAAAGVPLGVCAEGGAQAINGAAFDGAMLPSDLVVINCTAAAVAPNDILDWGAGNAAKANNAAPAYTAIGRATSFKAAGAPGAVRATTV